MRKGYWRLIQVSMVPMGAQGQPTTGVRARVMCPHGIETTGCYSSGDRNLATDRDYSIK